MTALTWLILAVLLVALMLVLLGVLVLLHKPSPKDTRELSEIIKADEPHRWPQ